MPLFTEDQLKQLENERETIAGKKLFLLERFLGRNYLSDRGREFAHHGFLRRVNAMERCITNVFTRLPPEQGETPTEDERHDIELFVQAFVFHVFGAADNLAWIWVKENDVQGANGRALGNRAIGIRSEAVFESLPQNIQEIISVRADWFDYLESFRHSLAHRIPLYIPPYVVTQANESEYNKISERIAEAERRLDFEERAQLITEQRRLTDFRPWMQHSFIEEVNPVVFHSQMLADFNTIDELARLILAALPKSR
jgi:hypothetical protein